MLTDKAWITRTLARRETAETPYNLMFSPPILQTLQRHYAMEDLESALHFPIRMSGTQSIKPLYADPRKYGDTIVDEFGVVWSTSTIDRGSPIGPCLKAATLANYTFPDPTASYRFAHIVDWCREKREHYTIIWVGDLWERATFMCGMESLLLEVALHSSFVDTLLEQLTEYIMQTMDILFTLGDFDGIAVSDDYGAQQAMLLSPNDWRRLIKPRLARIYAAAKTHGRTVFHHSCGNIRPIIGDLIDIGLDILHPIQPEAMDIYELKQQFGRQLTFCGGIDTQRLLPYGSPEEIRREVESIKRRMGAGGGYILEPGITVQADVPEANLLALIDAVVPAERRPR